jgi:hypothetical protein
MNRTRAYRHGGPRSTARLDDDSATISQRRSWPPGSISSTAADTAVMTIAGVAGAVAGGADPPADAGCRVERAEDGPEPDGAEEPGGHGWGEGDEPAVRDAHHDGEQHEPGVAAPGGQPDREAQREHDERQLHQAGGTQPGAERAEAEPSEHRAGPDDPDERRRRAVVDAALGGVGLHEDERREQ